MSDTSNYLFLLKHAHYPILLVKIGLQPHVITIKARRFLDGIEMHSMNLSLSFSESTSTFLVVPNVRGRAISEPDVIHLLVGTSTGGLYARILTIKELLNGFNSCDNFDEEVCFLLKIMWILNYLLSTLTVPLFQLKQNRSIHNEHPYLINYIQVPETQRSRGPSLSSSTISTGWRCLIGHIGASISCLDACPQYGLIASGDAEGRVVIWDMVSMAYITLLNMDDNCAVFGRVCGLAFDQKSGDLVVTRSGPNGSFG